MGDPIRCFLLEPAGTQRVRLRRFTFGVNAGAPDVDDHVRCPQGRIGKDGYQSGHEAAGPVVVEHEPASIIDEDGGRGHWAGREDWPGDDPRWPTVCELCNQPLPAAARKQTFVDHWWKRVDTGELYVLRDAAAGAMWDAWWLPWKGADGRSLVVKLPDQTEWSVDHRASNCGRPDDNVHRCWVRHGDPPDVTVDKDGDTCAAGAGSIATPTWHGFLRGGSLVE